MSGCVCADCTAFEVDLFFCARSYEDLDLMTDFEIHRFVEPYKILNKYALTKDEWMDVSPLSLLQRLSRIKRQCNVTHRRAKCTSSSRCFPTLKLEATEFSYSHNSFKSSTSCRKSFRRWRCGTSCSQVRRPSTIDRVW